MRFPIPTLNPVMGREARVRMRGWKTPALITVYVGVLGLVVTGVLIVAMFDGSQVFAPEIGSVLNMVLTVGQFLLLCLAAPGLTAGVIAGERERQTLDLLLLTRLSPLQVVVGKLGAAVSFTLLLLLASLPVYSVLFLLGGVSLSRLTMTVAIYVVTVIFFGAIGVYYSALFKRTQAAVVASYATAICTGLIPFIISLLMFEVFNRPDEVPPAWGVIFGYINPAFGLSAAAGGPLAELTGLYRLVLTTPAMRETIWWKYSLFALAASAGLVWLTSRKIRPLKDG